MVVASRLDRGGRRTPNRCPVGPNGGKVNPGLACPADFAEYQPYFFTAPEVAMSISAEKFLYVNQMMGQHYTPEQIDSVARKVGLGLQDVAAARGRMLAKVAAAPEKAGLVDA